ncbi:hypothetical protein B0H16DRAFT_1725199 [Mycena metata]|uniref:Uncharacterized protein n=1 Tax=Mycena metata TaxID=1033252 RepID=A0AAD7IRT6_9AGAR|nr:hypothetical protein B0H16DRAFT_1725199 [Mycena metata]
MTNSASTQTSPASRRRTAAAAQTSRSSRATLVSTNLPAASLSPPENTAHHHRGGGQTTAGTRLHLHIHSVLGALLPAPRTALASSLPTKAVAPLSPPKTPPTIIILGGQPPRAPAEPPFPRPRRAAHSAPPAPARVPEPPASTCLPPLRSCPFCPEARASLSARNRPTATTITLYGKASPGTRRVSSSTALPSTASPFRYAKSADSTSLPTPPAPGTKQQKKMWNWKRTCVSRVAPRPPRPSL